MEEQKRFYPFPLVNNGSHYHQSKEIGYYSLDRNRQISYDKSQLRYLDDTNNREFHNFDLNHGIEKFHFQYHYFSEKLDHILKWVLAHRDVFVDQTRSPKTHRTENTTDKLSFLKTDFVVKRSCLTKILSSSDKTSWEIAVIRFKDTFYLSEIKTRKEQNDYEKLLSHYTSKFEQYLTTDEPNGEPDTSIPTNNCEAYYTVRKTDLNSHSLILNGQIDCVDNTNGKYVDLILKREVKDGKEKYFFKRYHLLRYWVSSYLFEVPRIIFGFRHDNVLQRLEICKCNEIPYMVKDIKYPWDPNSVVNFLDQFLTFIKETITVNDHRKVYFFTYEIATKSIIYKLLEPDSEFHFLPQWYIDEFEN